MRICQLILEFEQESAISNLREWLSDAAIGNNPVLRLIAGIIYMHEQDYNEALKHTNSGGTMELLVLLISFLFFSFCPCHFPVIFYFSFILSTKSYGQKQESTAQLRGAHYHEHKAAVKSCKEKV